MIYDITKKVFILESKIDDNILLEKLKNKVIKDTKTNPYKPINSLKGAIMTDFKSYINDEDFIQFITSLKNILKKINITKFKIQDAWGCWYKKDSEDYCELHDHRGVTKCCGILYLSDHGPGTCFPEINVVIKEQIGKVVLFDPILLHEVKHFIYKEDRYTLPFNLSQIREGEDY